MLLPLPVVADELTATVDRTKIDLGETLTLTLRYGGQALGEPDFSALDKQFEILSTQRQSQLSFGGGSDSSSTEWRLTLMPRDTGTLLIPSFRFRGEVSDAVQIEVGEQAVTADAEQPFFVETVIDTRKPHIHEQVVLTFQVHSAQSLLSLSAAELEVPGARVVRIHETQYQRTVNGRNYGVVELSYALFPERAGPLDIPALRFRGEVPAADNNFRSFGFSAFGQSRKPVVMASAAQTLEVLPRPEGIPANQWLPSKGLSLGQRWSRELDELVVGEPVTRSVIISAQGLQGAQLPSLEAEPHDDFRFYPDQPRIEDSVSNSGVVGSRIESTAIIPTRPGELVLPEIRVKWWDTVSGEARETLLEAITVQVAPAPGAAATPSSGADASASVAEPSLQPGGSILSGPILSGPSALWLWLSLLANLLLALLALAFGLLWWKQRKGSVSGATTSPGDTRRNAEQMAFKRLRQCSAEQPAELRQAVLQWARLRWPQRRLATLDDVIAVSEDPALAGLLKRLDTSLYSSRCDAAGFGAQDLAELTNRLDHLRRQQPKQRGTPSSLPDLYPT
ncbi:MAG: BatD family protein [Porticoccaceae bacterium]